MSPKEPTGMHISHAGFSEGSPSFFLQVVTLSSTPLPTRYRVLSNIRILQFLSKRVHSKGRQFIKQIIKMLTGTFKQIREKLSPFPFPWVEQLFALSVGHRYSQKSQSSGIFMVRGSDVCVFLFLESLVTRATWRERQRTKRTRY